MALATVISLMNTIEHLTAPNNPQIISATSDELKLLKDALTRSYGCGNSTSNSRVINLLDYQITEALHNLEDVLHQQVMEEVDSCLETIKNLREEYIRDSTVKELGEEYTGDSKMIGLSDQFERIREEILHKKAGLKTLSLSGMAGIGPL